MKARGGDDEGQGDEGADADHLKHVEEHGGAEADAALEMRGGGWRRKIHEAAWPALDIAASVMTLILLDARGEAGISEKAKLGARAAQGLKPIIFLWYLRHG